MVCTRVSTCLFDREEDVWGFERWVVASQGA